MGIFNWIRKWTGSDGRADCNGGAAGGSCAGHEIGKSARSDDRSGPSSQPQSKSSKPVEEALLPWWAPEGPYESEPLVVERPELSPEAIALESLLVSHFDGHDLAMPPLPQVAERMLRSLRESNCDFRKLGKDLSQDPVIAAEILRTANSVLYGGLDKIVTLPTAIARLGTHAISSLMMRHSLRAATFSNRNQDAELSSILWYRALAGGHLLRSLARFTRCDEEEAFLIGLLHDIGNVIVLRLACDQQAVLKTKIDLPTFDYLCFECHQEFGELIAGAWNLPPKLKALISEHHVYPTADDPLRTERLALILADMINSLLGYGPPACVHVLESRVVADLQLRGRQDFAEFLRALPAELENTLDSFGEPPGTRKTQGDKRSARAPFQERLAAIRRGRTPNPDKLARRRFPRWSTTGTEEMLCWTDERRNATTVRVADMSERGLSIWFPKRLDVASTVHLADDGGDLQIQARVANVSDQSSDKRLFRIGLELVAAHPLKSGEANRLTVDLPNTSATPVPQPPALPNLAPSRDAT